MNLYTLHRTHPEVSGTRKSRALGVRALFDHYRAARAFGWTVEGVAVR